MPGSRWTEHRSGNVILRVTISQSSLFRYIRGRSGASVRRFALAGNGDVQRLCAARSISAFGSSGTLAVLLLWLTTSTGSPRFGVLVVAAEIAPGLIFGYWGGMVADRFDRRRILVISDCCRGALVLVLLVADASDTVLVLSLVVGMSAFSVVSGPAGLAYSAAVIPRPDRPRVVGTLQSSVLLSGLFGTAAGSGLFAVTQSPKLMFVLDAATFAAAAALTIRIRVAGRPVAASRAGIGGPQSAAPIRALLAEPEFRLVLLATAVGTAALTVVGSLHVPLALSVLDLSPFWYAGTELAFVASAIGAGLVVGWTRRLLTVPAMASAALLLAVVGAGASAVAPAAAVLVLAQIPLGGGQNLLGAAVALTVQDLEADELRGRAAAVSAASADATSMSALLLTAAVAPALGVRLTLAVASVAMLFSAGLILRKAVQLQFTGQ